MLSFQKSIKDLYNLPRAVQIFNSSTILRGEKKNPQKKICVKITVPAISKHFIKVYWSDENFTCTLEPHIQVQILTRACASP